MSAELNNPYMEQTACQSTERTSNQDYKKMKYSFFSFTKTSKVVTYLVFSVLLFAAVLAGITALINYLSTGEAVLFTVGYSGDKVSLFQALNELYSAIAADTEIESVLASLFNNFNEQVYSNLFTVSIYASSIIFTAMLLLTAVYNTVYLICIKKITNQTSLFLQNGSFADTKKEENTVFIFNIVYAALSYLSIIVAAFSVIMMTITAGAVLGKTVFADLLSSGDDISSAVTATKVFIIISYVIFLVVSIVLIINKIDRISEFGSNGKYICYENLSTYLEALAVTLIPLLVIVAIAIVIFILIIRFITALIFHASSD